MSNFINNYYSSWQALTHGNEILDVFPRYANYSDGLISIDTLMMEAQQTMKETHKHIWKTAGDLAEDIVVTLNNEGDPRHTFTYRHLDRLDVNPKPVGALLMAMAFEISFKMNEDDVTFLTAIADIVHDVTQANMVG